MYDPISKNTVTRFSMTDPLRHVLVAHARDVFRSQAFLSAHWKDYNYAFCPDFNVACRESDAFIMLLESHGVKISMLPPEHCVGLDSLYVHDPVVTLPRGCALCNMGKPKRKKEPQAVGQWLESNGHEIVGEVQGPGQLEGGDVVWLTPELAMVGIGYRSNLDGMRQLRQWIGHATFQIEPVYMPHWNGPEDVLHLMSIISPLSEKELLVYSRIMPVVTRNRLLELGFNLIEVPESEYNSMGCNVLSLGNNVCVIEKQNIQTAALLRSHGYRVEMYDGSNISKPGEGGPTCLTRPILRG